MPDSESKPDSLPQRLCSEIQLFDLCDEVSCHHKNGRFCTDPVLLSRFEKISENELRIPDRTISEVDDDAEADDCDDYDEEEYDEFSTENTEDEDD